MRPELPPTAGLPVELWDFFRKPKASLPHGLQQWLALPDPVVTCSGTAALVAALQTLRQREPYRTTVIIPAYTCPLVALAVGLVPGLRIVVCDTSPSGFDFDAQQLAGLCDEKTLAIMPTHLGGRVADVPSAVVIAKRCGAAVIEDAAQAMGAYNQGTSVGLLGDVGFFSLAAGKGLTMYEGGVLLSRNPEIAAALRATAAKLLPGISWNLRRIIELLGYAFFYTPSGLRYVYGRQLRKKLAENNEVEAVGDDFSPADIPLHRPDSLRLRVAANALERFPAYLASGRKRAMKRLVLLQDLEGVSVVTDKAGTDGVWPFFMLLLPTREQRDSALRTLWTSGLGVSKLFIHALPDYAYLTPNLERGSDCPNARDFASRMLTITNTHWLDDERFHLIREALRSNL